mgnify:CR=1 FL=1
MGKVLAVCISEKKGTQKRNVGSAVFVEDWGLEGDAHAGKWHRQVSLLSSEKINAFRAKGAEVEDGAFGENLVVEGIDFAKLPVGTRFRCGEVVLELTQIGKECHNGCAIFQKMGECIMPREGVFTRVLKGGKVSVGDEMSVDKAMIFDTHAHYDADRFDSDRDALLSAMPGVGVGLVLDPGCDLPSSRAAAELAERYPHVYAAVGIHPENCGDFLPEHINVLRRLARQPKVVAIGEIGLDYYWEQNPPREWQQEVFRAQLALAQELSLPVIVHDRDAHADSLAIVKEFPDVRGVFHCYSGSAETAQELIARGWYLGFDGPLTYKNAKKTVEVARIVPLERVLLETDSPYMSPVPVRGTRNDSRNVFHIAAKFAELRGMEVDEVIALTSENGKRLFGIE